MEQLEAEAQKLQEAHQEIIMANERRERIETMLRAKLEQEIQKLRASRTHQADVTEMQQELSKRDVLISQLLGQSEYLASY